MKICPYCHLENPDQAKHCLACGKKLIDEKPKRFGIFKKKEKQEEQTNPQKPVAQEEVSSPAQSASDYETNGSTPLKNNVEEDQFLEGKTKEKGSVLDRLLSADQPEKRVEYTPLSDRLQPDISSVDMEAERRRRQEQLERQQKAQREAQMAMMPNSPKNDKQKMLLTGVICLLSCLVIVLGVIVMTQSARDHANRPHTPTDSSSIKRYFDDSYTDDWKSTQTDTNTFEEVEDTEWAMSDDSGEFIEDILSEEDTAGTSTGHGDLYITNYVMKVRQKPSLDAESIGSLEAQEEVEIVDTRTDSNGTIWGALANDEGWVCIQDSEQTYLTEME